MKLPIVIVRRRVWEARGDRLRRLQAAHAALKEKHSLLIEEMETFRHSRHERPDHETPT